MIHLHNVQKIYAPDQRALSGVDLRIYAGDFVFVAGASGAGKSTLLDILYGAERCTSGEVVVAGRSLGRTTDEEEVAALRRDIGVIFQDYKLLSRRTVAENVAFGLEVQGVRRRARNDLAMEMLQCVGLQDRAKAFPCALSGGEQQRVAIARALIHRPRLILADEPTGNLDSEMARVVFDLLLEANASGVTVVVATHNLSVIEDLNLRTIILDRGKLIGDFEQPGRIH